MIQNIKSDQCMLTASLTKGDTGDLALNIFTKALMEKDERQCIKTIQTRLE